MNSLLGFSYYAPEEDSHTMGRPRRGRKTSYSPAYNKEQFMQAAFQFVLKPPKQPDDYLKYLVNPDEIIEWRDVVEATLTPSATAEKIVCPICLNAASEIVAPRVTKCGHIFCWPCLLQYLGFERVHAWKKCPLCCDPIYKRDIRRATLKVLGTS